jgi:MoxR-like ATPase
VFDWEDARRHHEEVSVTKGLRPAEPDPSWKWEAKNGTVLLIDEVDKADPDLPNGLLESFGNGQFAVPYRDEAVRCHRDHEPPLVVVTTNEERELPAAFVRRCLVLPLSLPKGVELVRLLANRGSAHFGDRFTKKVYEAAAEQLVKEREEQAADALVKPGQAEYLDLLRALLEVARPDPEDQLRVLGQIKDFALDKNAPPGT